MPWYALLYMRCFRFGFSFGFATLPSLLRHFKWILSEKEMKRKIWQKLQAVTLFHTGDKSVCHETLSNCPSLLHFTVLAGNSYSLTHFSVTAFTFPFTPQQIGKNWVKKDCTWFLSVRRIATLTLCIKWNNEFSPLLWSNNIKIVITATMYSDNNQTSQTMWVKW